MKSFILVTGASTGLGRVICERLDEQGFGVIAAMRNTGKCAWLSQKPAIHGLRLDVTSAEDIETLAQNVSDIIGSTGSLTCVINNAGVCISAPLETVSLDDFRYQLEVNVVGVLAVTKAVLPYLVESKGTIINVGSGVGRVAPPFLGPYAASKAALEAMTDSLRRELVCTHVNATLVVPGAILTPVWDKLSDSTSRVLNTMTQDQVDRYQKNFVHFSNENARSANSSKTTAGDVAQCVSKILTSKRVKPSYIVGNDAVAGSILNRLLPTRTIDFVFRKMAVS